MVPPVSSTAIFTSLSFSVPSMFSSAISSVSAPLSSGVLCRLRLCEYSMLLDCTCDRLAESRFGVAVVDVAESVALVVVMWPAFSFVFGFSVGVGRGWLAAVGKIERLLLRSGWTDFGFDTVISCSGFLASALSSLSRRESSFSRSSAFSSAIKLSSTTSEEPPIIWYYASSSPALGLHSSSSIFEDTGIAESLMIDSESSESPSELESSLLSSLEL